jgi:hypothetical protein
MSGGFEHFTQIIARTIAYNQNLQAAIRRNALELLESIS